MKNFESDKQHRGEGTKVERNIARGYFLQLYIDVIIQQDIFMYSVGKNFEKE